MARSSTLEGHDEDLDCTPSPIKARLSRDDAPVLGIDLGTTNSVIAIADGAQARVLLDADGNGLIPSCVSFLPDDSVVVGHPARERRLVDAGNTVYSIKRLIGRPFTSAEVQRARERFPFALEPSKTGGVQVNVRKGIYALPEISAMVLRHLRKVAEASLGVECTRAVITVPANFNELQRSATRAAGKVAGLDVLRILNEPTAATLAYGYGKTKPERVAVYDLGGGTFDITLLDLDGDVFEVVSTAGDTFLGGDDIDLAVAELMAERCIAEHGFDPRQDSQAFERLRAAGEWAKCQLSSVEEADLTLEELFQSDAGRMIDFHFRIDRSTLEARLTPIVERSFDVVNDALREGGRRPREVESVVMVGGSTRIPLVRRMVQEFFGGVPRTDIDPDLVVAQGAAIHGWTLSGKPRSVRPARSEALGHVALRKVTLAELGGNARAGRVRVTEEQVAPVSKATGERLPKGPAFAPEERAKQPQPKVKVPRPTSVLAPPKARSPEPEPPPIDVPAPVPRPSPPAGDALSSLPDQPRPSHLVAKEDAGGLFDLDAPNAPQATIKPNAQTRKPREPTLMFGTQRPNVDEVRKMALMELDAPPGLPPPATQREPYASDGLFEVELEQVTRSEPRSPERPAIQMQRIVSVSDVESVPPESIDFDEEMMLDEPAYEEVVEVDDEPEPLAPRIAALPLPEAPAPLLMDVTPFSLGVETAGGFCQMVVPRNAPVPAEKSRIFTTARDHQEAVEVRVCQGEGIKFADNQVLGTFTLEHLRKATRGAVRVEVTFLLDASGILDVRATDLDTRRVQTTRIQLQGGIETSEIEAMRQRQERELGG